MTTQIEFVDRCEAVGLKSGSLYSWLDKVETLTRERDELLEALKCMLNAAQNDITPECDKARAAIASVKGGAA